MRRKERVQHQLKIKEASLKDKKRSKYHKGKFDYYNGNIYIYDIFYGNCFIIQLNLRNIN